jgi:hypothetical protein
MMTKGHDHEIMKDLETHPKVVQWKFEIGFCVGRGFQV